MTEALEIPEEEEDYFEHFNIVTGPGQEPLRIDKFLVDRLPNTSRHKIQIAAKSGNILVGGKKIKPNYKIRPKDEISVVLPYPRREIELRPENIPLDVIYQDDHVVVLSKQPGLVVHPGYGNYTGTLVNGLMRLFEDLPVKEGDKTDRPGLVHRLDKDTSGIMVVARNEIALNHLASQFFHRSTDRRYAALVWGDVPEEEGTITGHIGRSPRDRKVMTIFPEGDQGKAAITHYKVVERFGYVTLVECKLETGRTHQIRAHFRYLGYPLFGDKTYGGDRILKGTTFSKYKQFVENCFAILPRQALHAKMLEFEHPKTGERMRFEGKLPDDIEQVLAKWRKYAQNSRDI